MMILRPYQSAAIDDLYAWWITHPEIEDVPILVMPTGSGKSVVIAEMVRLLWDHWPEDQPRTLVIVPSKELAEQNADKLMRMLPENISIGYYSASVGKKQPNADVIVATIGSIAKKAHVLGNIKMVIVDECHLISPDGAGQYRYFLRELAKYCAYRVVGLTATPFRGNGVWLTDGKDPLFTGIAHEVTMSELMDAGHLAPMIRPKDLITRIDSTDIEISKSTGDYDLHDLSERVNAYLPQVADETIDLASDRMKWLAFTPTVVNADTLRRLFVGRGISCAVVVGETPKLERAGLIAQYRAGKLRCLITVLALATGFDVPDVDCLIWVRSTISPVLYIQGAGRGMRSAPGKTDCLWLDFTDTTERLGPLDAIKGRVKTKKSGGSAPYAICDACGSHVRPASALVCPECGHQLREEEEKQFNGASNAAILSITSPRKIQCYDVTKVDYKVHKKEGSPDSIKVEYWNVFRIVAQEWVCLDHEGYACEKAHTWLLLRDYNPYNISVHETVRDLSSGGKIKEPVKIHVNESGKYPEIIQYEWDKINHE